MKKRSAGKQDQWSGAQESLVGGVSSPVRAFGAVGGEPLIIDRGKGARVTSSDGRRFIDYVLGWGSMILGYAEPSVVGAAQKAVARGMYFGTTNPDEISLAQTIKKAVPFVEKLRFTVSGTEAVMGALRVARGATGRNLVVKFENSYHGHADHLLAKAGSGLATYALPVSLGVPKDFLKNTLVLPYGDRAALEDIFHKYGEKIAAVIVEPVGGNYGVLPPDIRFLKKLRQVTRAHGAFLVADEVITGFRFCYGSFMTSIGITPDLICFGKIIGGGMPAAAYGGRAWIMDHLAPLGKVYQASTFSAHPVAMAAGVATLQQLYERRMEYPRLVCYARLLSEAIQSAAQEQGVDVVVTQFGPMFSLCFAKDGAFRVFYQALLKEGVYLAPSQFEANFISFAHQDKTLKATIQAVRRAMLLTGRRFLSCSCSSQAGHSHG